MIHLNDLDFHVCRFEEVISFFWRSVYMESAVIIHWKNVAQIRSRTVQLPFKMQK